MGVLPTGVGRLSLLFKYNIMRKILSKNADRVYSLSFFLSAPFSPYFLLTVPFSFVLYVLFFIFCSFILYFCYFLFMFRSAFFRCVFSFFLLNVLLNIHLAELLSLLITVQNQYI
jgi:hypothetical protein